MSSALTAARVQIKLIRLLKQKIIVHYVKISYMTPSKIVLHISASSPALDQNITHSVHSSIHNKLSEDMIQQTKCGIKIWGCGKNPDFCI